MKNTWIAKKLTMDNWTKCGVVSPNTTCDLLQFDMSPNFEQKTAALNLMIHVHTHFNNYAGKKHSNVAAS